MCSFAVTHIFAILKNSGNSNVLPGLVHSHILMASCVHQKDGQIHSKTKKKNSANFLDEAEEDIRVDICLGHVNRLGYLGMNFCLSERILQEV